METSNVAQATDVIDPAQLTDVAGKAFRHARRKFMRGERIDMTVLSAELDVNRATLYRWLGRREGLIVSILWTLSEITLTDATEEFPISGWGRQRTPEVLTRFVSDSLASCGTRTFLRDEGDLAMRLLTTASHGYQPRLLAAIESLLADDVAHGYRESSEPLPDIAFGALRMIEAHIHLNRITGQEPDAGRARNVLAVLLR